MYVDIFLRVITLLKIDSFYGFVDEGRWANKMREKNELGPSYEKNLLCVPIRSKVPR